MKPVKMMDDVLPQNVINTLCRLLCSQETKYPYIKLKDGQYRTYCPDCQRYNTVSKEEFKKIRSEKVCPLCKTRFSCTTNTVSKKYHDYISLEWNNLTVGYSVVAEWHFDQPIKCLGYTQYLKIIPHGKTMVKCGYGIGAMGQKIVYDEERDNGYWRESRSERFYWVSLDYYSTWTYKYGTRYDIRKMLADCYQITKSNQVKMVLQHRYKDSIVKGIHLFDLNTHEEVEKYSQYLCENHIHYRELDTASFKKNVYLLDYLYRNNIDLGQYITYTKNLKLLGFEIDRPTDFNHRYKVIEEMVEAARDKELDEKIIKRFNSLPRYSKDNISISPFKEAKQIRKCGKRLHNCIGGYVERYANGLTDIYHLDLDGAIKVAIEINNNSLWQAYEDKNVRCCDEYMQYIKDFCKENNFALERQYRYA